MKRILLMMLALPMLAFSTPDEKYMVVTVFPGGGGDGTKIGPVFVDKSTGIQRIPRKKHKFISQSQIIEFYEDKGWELEFVARGSSYVEYTFVKE